MSGRFGTKPGRQSVYRGAYSSDFSQVGKDTCNLMAGGRDGYNPADTIEELRAGKTSQNTQTPAPFRFQDDTVDVNDGINMDTHVRGGFSAEVSRSSNHPKYKRQPR